MNTVATTALILVFVLTAGFGADRPAQNSLTQREVDGTAEHKRFEQTAALLSMFEARERAGMPIYCQRRKGQAEQGGGSASGRITPPTSLHCDRSSLTSYNGRVLYFNRRIGRTHIRVLTDWDTTEEVTLSHPGTDDPSKLFLLNGKPFKPSDWELIETRRNRLREGMRANIWVCRDRRITPVIDWRPDETEANKDSR